MSHLDTLLVIVVFDEGSASNSCVVVVIPRVIFYEGFDFLYEVRLVDIADLVGADVVELAPNIDPTGTSPSNPRLSLIVIVLRESVYCYT